MKFGFEVKFDNEDQHQSIPKSLEILNKLFCPSGPNLVTLAWIGDELFCGQAQNGIYLDFQVKFDL